MAYDALPVGCGYPDHPVLVQSLRALARMSLRGGFGHPGHFHLNSCPDSLITNAARSAETGNPKSGKATLYSQDDLPSAATSLSSAPMPSDQHAHKKISRSTDHDATSAERLRDAGASECLGVPSGVGRQTYRVRPATYRQTGWWCGRVMPASLGSWIDELTPRLLPCRPSTGACLR